MCDIYIYSIMCKENKGTESQYLHVILIRKGTAYMSHLNKEIYNQIELKKENSRLKTDLEAAKGKGLSIDKLKSEQNFIEYIKMLRFFSKRYMVMISARDTPCGPAYSNEISLEVMKLGLQIDLSNKFRYGYAAIIDAGELKYENISSTVFDWVECKCTVDDVSIEIKSIGFNAPQNSTGLILINGINYSPSGRGLNFVVFDRVTKSVLDAVNFDTYSENFPCRRPSAIKEGLLNYKKMHPDISILCFSTPTFPSNNLSANENFIIDNAVGRGTILNNLDKPVFALNKYFNKKEDIIEVLNAPKSYHDITNVRRFEDISGNCVNTAGGHRVTVGQPQNYKRTVFLIGGCKIFGVGASDKGTIASHLQKLLNELGAEQHMIVQNYGYFLAELEDAETGEELAILNSLPVKSGDIILLDFTMINQFPCLNLSSAAERPHNYGEIFYDTLHYTEDGNRLIADKLFEKLQQLNFFTNQTEITENNMIYPEHKENMDYNLDAKSKKKLLEYKKILTEFYNSMFGITIGSIVMNCNPFTLGHRYLIEQAAAKCDHLIIFVVQEDKSVFPFDDRLKLVLEGTSDLKNISVVPSSQFIISSLTFSEYFNKSEIQDHLIDASLDVTLFGREIAPCLNISMRFAGEEPYDKVTKQYNDTMRATLPKYGIEFVEIPRKEYDGIPISASHVRKLLKNRDFDEIGEIVPKTTLDYLRARF